MRDLTLASASITSAEIAELVGSRHDSVKRAIERLVNQGVIESPPMVEIRTATNIGSAFRFEGERGKRDSIVVVAQLSPEFTARLVDRWQELERQAALGSFSLPKTMSEALRLAADQADRIEALEHQAAQDAPKIAALDRFANHEGQHNVRNTAKLLGVRERLFTAWLIAHDWAYRDHAGRLCAKAGKLADGCMDTVPVEVLRSTGIHTYPQPYFTQKGLARLAVLLAKDGLIPKEVA